MRRTFGVDERLPISIEFAWGQEVGDVFDLAAFENWEWSNVAGSNPLTQLALPGTAGSRAILPDQPEFNFDPNVSDLRGISVRVHNLLLDWESADLEVIIGQRDVALGWEIIKLGSGNGLIVRLGDGTVVNTFSFPAFVLPAPGEPIDFRFDIFSADPAVPSDGRVELFVREGAPFFGWDFIEQVDSTGPLTHAEVPLTVGAAATGGSNVTGSIGAVYIRDFDFPEDTIVAGEFFERTGRQLPDKVQIATWLMEGDARLARVPIGIDFPGGTPDSNVPENTNVDRVPNDPSLHVTGDLTVIVEFPFYVPPPAGDIGARDECGIFSRYFVTGANRSWFLRGNPDGSFRFSWSPDGAGATMLSETTSVIGTVEEKLVIAFTLDVDDGAGNHISRLWRGETRAGPWTLLSGTVRVGTTSVFAGTADLTVSEHLAGQGNAFKGAITYVELASGIDGSGEPGGTTVASRDYTWAFPTYTDPQGNEWNLEGSEWRFLSDAGRQGYFLGDPITINQGARDEISQLTPSTCELQLDNPDGRFSPSNPESPLYPNIRRNTPLRVRVWWLGEWWTRFFGFVDEWQPGWPYGDLSAGGTRQGESRVTLSASGYLRRLGQGEGLVDSPLFRAIMYQDLFGDDPADERVSYWPLEDPEDATEGKNYGTGTGSRYSEPFRVFAGGEFAADDSLISSKPALQFDGGFAFNARAAIIEPGSWAVEFNVRVGQPESTPGIPLMVILCGSVPDGGGAVRWVISTEPAFIQLRAWNSADTMIVDSGVSFTEVPHAGGSPYDRWVRMSLRVREDGGNVLWTLGWAPCVPWAHFTGNGSSFAGQAGRIYRLENFTGAPEGGLSYAHVTTTRGTRVEPLGVGVGSDPHANNAWEGETSEFRHIRLCIENNILPDLLVDIDSTEMGPQPIATITELLNEVAGTEASFYYEAHQRPFLTMKTRSYVYLGGNTDDVLVLDAATNGISAVDPILDDQRFVNRVRASAHGFEADIRDQASIDGEGEYATSIEPNVHTEPQLPASAGWRMAVGQAAGEPRLPSAKVEFTINRHLINRWLRFGSPGTGIRLRNLPKPQHPITDRDFKLNGWTEVLSPSRWEVAQNLQPAEPWQVGVLQSGPEGEHPEVMHFGPHKIDNPNSHLRDPVDTVEDVLILDDAGIDWTDDPDELPWHIRVGGEVMLVTSVSFFGSVQLLGVDRSINGVVKPHPAGARVQLAYPARLGLGPGRSGIPNPFS